MRQRTSTLLPYMFLFQGFCLDVKDYQHVADKENKLPDASYLARPILEETRDAANNSVALGGEGSTLQQLNNQDLDVTVNKDKVHALDICDRYF